MKAAARTAWTGVIPTELLQQLLIAMNEAEAGLNVGFRYGTNPDGIRDSLNCALSFGGPRDENRRAGDGRDVIRDPEPSENVGMSPALPPVRGHLERGLIGSNGVGIMGQDTFYAVRANHG